MEELRNNQRRTVYVVEGMQKFSKNPQIAGSPQVTRDPSPSRAAKAVPRLEAQTSTVSAYIISASPSDKLACLTVMPPLNSFPVGLSSLLRRKPKASLGSAFFERKHFAVDLETTKMFTAIRNQNPRKKQGEP